MCEELTSEDGLLLKGSRVIIPPVLKGSFLCDLNEEHAVTLSASSQLEPLSTDLAS